jgi:hypothetical protein
MKNSPGWAKALLTVAVAGATLGLWGCPNPNSIGVQQFGTVVVTCVLASNNQPVAGVIVTIGGTTATQPTDSTGKVTVTQVVIGAHPVDAHGAGVDGEPTTVTVIQDTTVNQTVLMVPSS